MSQSSDNLYTIAQIAEGAKPSVVSITNTSVEELTSMFGTREYEATSVYLALHIKKSASAVARIDGCICLDQISRNILNGK